MQRAMPDRKSATDTGLHLRLHELRGHSGACSITAIAADQLTRSDHPRARYLWDLIDTKKLQDNLAPLGVLVTTEHGPPDSVA